MSYSKYYLYKKQVSYDNGITWSDTLETVPSGNPIATYATLEECNGQSPSYSGQYLTFVAQESGTFTFTPQNSNVISYSKNNGTWTQGNSVSVSSGDTVRWKGTMTSNNGIGKFSSSGSFTAEGNPMSLLYGDNFSGQTSLSGKDYAFDGLFIYCTTVTSAENLSLPATTLASGCYFRMFEGCTSLTTAPELPATTLASNCYAYMFNGCTNLTTAPELLATTLANSCYYQMFRGCTRLTTAPQLPATTLANSCYSYMFFNCTNLTTAPQLPATTLAESCYQAMFKSCTSLTTAPSLQATTLATECCHAMFQGCTSLTTAPTLLATTLTEGCYLEMFSGCTSLNSITCLATDISARWCTIDWVSGVASSGTFIRDCNTQWSTGESGIPNNWQDNCTQPIPTIEGLLADYTNNNQPYGGEFPCCENFPTPLIASGTVQSASGISYDTSAGYYRIGSMGGNAILPMEYDGDTHTDTWKMTDNSEIYSITFIIQDRCLSTLQTALSGNTAIASNYDIYVGQPSGVDIPIPETSMGYSYTSVTCELKSGGTPQTSLSATSTSHFRIAKIYIQYYA